MTGKATLKLAADQASEKVADFYLEMLDAQKATRVKCECGRHFDWPVPDWSSRAKALETLLNFGYGRPGTQQDEQADLAAASAKATDELTPAERHLILDEARKRLKETHGETDGEAA